MEKGNNDQIIAILQFSASTLSLSLSRIVVSLGSCGSTRIYLLFGRFVSVPFRDYIYSFNYN